MSSRSITFSTCTLRAKNKTADGGSHHVDLDGNDFHVPTFTLKQIHDAIPQHCFKPSTARGLAYVVRDFTYLLMTTIVAYSYTPLLSSWLLRVTVYILSTALSGMIMTGIWILAHECGHGAFSRSSSINTTIGYLLHSFLLVPYHSWQISHSHHHKATGNLQRDTVFVPHTREYWVKHNHGHDSDPTSVTFAHLSEDSPLATLYHCLLHQLLGWPAYMLAHVSGQKNKRGFPQHSHYYFGKDSAIFKRSELSLVFLSDLGLAAMIYALYEGTRVYGLWCVSVFYVIPYLWLNHWVVAITYLQHTDARLPHYENSQWTFARGASATMDRDFGFIDTHLFHSIVSTHVCHHLVSKIPFYHAGEATTAIKKVMGKDYHADTTTSLWKALWRTQRDCQFVEEGKGQEGSGIFFFRNLHGRGTEPRNLLEGEAMSIWASL